MASPETIADDTTKPDTPWMPYQRPGKLGVDYDEYGEELAPNARVWKKYVEETDKADKELVDGWNKTLDVILIFAALFSAISTAFVIESSKDLKPDYTESSAQTLLLMSQTLSAIARGSPINDSVTSNAEPPSFTPTASAVAVNALWFLSLSLSVAVSLIAILAKEWCYSFMTGRVGSMLKQGRIRQQRWEGIEQWRMKEILNVLPLLMHIALLLFAIGLSLYLWSINIRVALPVVITTALVALFYAVTISLPLFFRFCPYTTALLRFIYPYWLRVLDRDSTKQLITALLMVHAWVSYGLQRLKQSFSGRKARRDDQPLANLDLEYPSNRSLSWSFRTRVFSAHARFGVDNWIEEMRGMFLTDRSQLIDRETLMDKVTSSMISWMISNCEDSKSVDMALQALAGADVRLLPRQPLWECGAVQLLPQRIEACTDALERFSAGSQREAYNSLLDDASLYSRSLGFLTAFFRGEGLKIGETYEAPFPLRGTHELAIENPEWKLRMILRHSWIEPDRRYEIAAYELSTIPVEADATHWTEIEHYREQHSRQWELLKYVTSGHVELPLSAVLSLVSGITKTYPYDPSHSPILLVHLLNKLYNPANFKTLANNTIDYTIGAGLAVAAIANQNHPGVATNPSNNLDVQRERAKQAYGQIIARSMGFWEIGSLLAFGLLSLLAPQNQQQKWELTIADIQLIGNILDRLGIANHAPYHNIIPALPSSFNHGQHLAQVVLDSLSATSQESNCDSVSTSPALSRLDAVLSRPLCGADGKHIVLLLTNAFARTESLEIKKLCLKGIRHSLSGSAEDLATVINHLLNTAFLEQLMGIIGSSNGSLVPYSMRFLWAAGGLLVENIVGPEWNRQSIAPSLLRVLRNRFTVDSPNNGLPKDIGDTGLADLWLHNLCELCHNDPQNVLESELLSTMIEFYEGGGNVDKRPHATELPSPFDETYTWLKILQHLEASCKAAVAEQAGDSEQPAREVEAHSPVLDAHEQSKGDVGTSRDLYWAM